MDTGNGKGSHVHAIILRKYNPIQSYSLHYTAMNTQLHAPAPLPSVSVKDGGSFSQSGLSGGEKNLIPLAGIKPQLLRSERQSLYRLS